jgi:hypothetical protein
MEIFFLVLPFLEFKMELFIKHSRISAALFCATFGIPLRGHKYVSFFYVIIINLIYSLHLSCSHSVLICGNKIALEFVCPDNVLCLNVFCC